MAEPGSTAVPRVWAIVTCKGRRHHLERTLPRLLSDSMLGCCLVDYDCPDGPGDWFVEQAKAKAVRACLVQVARAPLFHKAKAQNLGANHAILAGARALLFVDADTLCNPGLGSWIDQHTRGNHFCIASLDAKGGDIPGLLGVIALPAEWFTKAGGYDERFHDWGAEDIEFRLRLHLLYGLEYREIPPRFLESIDHDDALRSAYYTQKSIARSNTFNQVYMAHKLHRLTGISIHRLPSHLRRLLRQTGT